MKRFLFAVVAIAITGTSLPLSADEPTRINFITHLAAGLNEIDVFVDTGSNPSDVYRVTPATKARFLDSPVFASAEPLAHNPFDAEAVGPHAKGRPLGLTLVEFLAARGTATITCQNGQGSIDARFTKLVPNAVYSMWYAFVPQPPTKPFTGALDLPFGARDGSQSVFTTDAKGNARFNAAYKPCLQASSDQLMAVLAIAWHSDGKTYGSSPGSFGNRTHVQLFAPLPRRKVIHTKSADIAS